MCGEIGSLVQHSQMQGGSPPRVWGNRGLECRQGHHRRFTPTCVGKSQTSPSHPPPPAVHPHVCGEIPARGRPGSATGGSPPRVWGNPWASDPLSATYRFTPTCVGKSRLPRCRLARLTVHPHVCGEISAVEDVRSTLAGSPPRVWGNLWKIICGITRIRFTPTCVGKSDAPAPRSNSAPVHPHVCGEIVPLKPWTAGGSVHPHVCGEIITVKDSAGMLYGSPPRVWGNLM